MSSPDQYLLIYIAFQIAKYTTFFRDFCKFVRLDKKTPDYLVSLPWTAGQTNGRRGGLMVAVCVLLGGVLRLDDTFCVYSPYLVILVLEILVAAAKLRHSV